KRVYFVQNAIGGILSPEDSNELARGIKTLSLRLDRQMENVLAIIAFLKKQAGIDKIYYPGDPDLAGYEELSKEATGAGGVFSCELDDEVYDPVVFVNSLRLFNLAVSLGAVESLVELPSKMSHAELSEEEQLAAGIKPGLIRFAVGIEDAADLIADIDQALEKAKR
ncbi:PLP-dependent transferase, partial [Lactobacillus sp.]|uniref:PLP-dependent transferase n=1 Tax=Lactobacillus sp. TaxID=1591 RepID=UPI003F0D1E90